METGFAMCADGDKGAPDRAIGAHLPFRPAREA